MKEIELNVKITVPANGTWPDSIADGLNEVASAITQAPQWQTLDGEGTNFLFSYNMKGVE